MSNELENRITELELCISHHDKQMAEMSDIITNQWKEIERLKNYLLKTEEQLAEMMDTLEEHNPKSASEFAKENKPPHY